VQSVRNHQQVHIWAAQNIHTRQANDK